MVVCSECSGNISDKALECVHCGALLTEPDFAIKYDNYQALPCAFKLISVCSVFFIIIIITMVVLCFGLLTWERMKEHWSGLLFLAYFIFFISVWVVYFVSKKPENANASTRFKTKTLRRLLGELVVFWQPNSLSEKDLTSLKNKAGSSMQVIAILIAVSALEMDMVSDIFFDCKFETCGLPRQITLCLAGIMGFVSIVLFVLSLDALDVLFNRFINKQYQQSVTSYYYQIIINRNYLGMVLMISGFILLVGYANFLCGCFSIIITLFFGYPHWFPEIKLDNSKCLCGFVVKIILILLALIPVLLLLKVVYQYAWKPVF